ncbi:MAG: amidohydrolase family protein [Nitrososphaeria archaeon]
MNVLVKNVNIVDVKTGAINENKSILIQDGQITEIDTGSLSPSSNPRVIDGENNYVIPGMADMHVHLNWDGGPDPRRTVIEEGSKIAILRAYKNAMDHLRIGVTTLLDVGSMDDLAIDLSTAIKNGVIFGPNVYSTGRIICIIGGHGAGMGYEISGPGEALTATRTLIKKGADLLKIAATSGAYGAFGAEKLESIQLDPEEIRTITSEASKYRIKVSAHALNLDGIRNCVNNGVSIIHHGAFLDKETAKLMKQKRVSLVPTLLVYQKLSEKVPGVMPEAIKKASEVIKHHKDAFLNAMEAGVKIVGGTDAYSPNFGGFPRIVDEAILMGEYGMNNEEVLRSITINAAELLEKDKTSGSVEEGKEADLVFLKDNPIKDLKNLKKVTKVIFKGIEI